MFGDKSLAAKLSQPGIPPPAADSVRLRPTYAELGASASSETSFEGCDLISGCLLTVSTMQPFKSLHGLDIHKRDYEHIEFLQAGSEDEMMMT